MKDSLRFSRKRKVTFNFYQVCNLDNSNPSIINFFHGSTRILVIRILYAICLHTICIPHIHLRGALILKAVYKNIVFAFIYISNLKYRSGYSIIHGILRSLSVPEKRKMIGFRANANSAFSIP